MKNNEFDFIEDRPAEDYSDKIEALWKEELKDKNRYTFCLGEMKINTNHKHPALGFYGQVDYSSKELAVFDGESEKLYIMSRQSDYNYDGVLKQTLGGMVGIDVPVKEHGKLVETYQKNMMPIRIDYSNKFIATDPETENKQ
ncbi:MAG: hypothetical protein WC422_01435 [Candidatus Paceibacterota bacterium]